MEKNLLVNTLPCISRLIYKTDISSEFQENGYFSGNDGFILNFL